MDPLDSPHCGDCDSHDPFSGLVADAECGGVFVVTRDGKPAAVIVGSAQLDALRAAAGV